MALGRGKNSKQQLDRDAVMPLESRRYSRRRRGLLIAGLVLGVALLITGIVLSGGILGAAIAGGAAVSATLAGVGVGAGFVAFLGSTTAAVIAGVVGLGGLAITAFFSRKIHTFRQEAKKAVEKSKQFLHGADVSAGDNPSAITATTTRDVQSELFKKLEFECNAALGRAMLAVKLKRDDADIQRTKTAFDEKHNTLAELCKTQGRPFPWQLQLAITLYERSLHERMTAPAPVETIDLPGRTLSSDTAKTADGGEASDSAEEQEPNIEEQFGYERRKPQPTPVKQSSKQADTSTTESDDVLPQDAKDLDRQKLPTVERDLHSKLGRKK